MQSSEGHNKVGGSGEKSNYFGKNRFNWSALPPKGSVQIRARHRYSSSWSDRAS